MPRLLVVDDNTDGRETLAELFRLRGYETSTAADGSAALSAVGRDRPDLVVMDLNMPGMDGWEAVGHLRANPLTARLPVIAMTAHVTAGDRERALAGGCDDHHPKPMLLPTLLAQIERLLAAPPA